MKENVMKKFEAGMFFQIVAALQEMANILEHVEAGTLDPNRHYIEKTELEFSNNTIRRLEDERNEKIKEQEQSYNKLKTELRNTAPMLEAVSSMCKMVSLEVTAKKVEQVIRKSSAQTSEVTLKKADLNAILDVMRLEIDACLFLQVENEFKSLYYQTSFFDHNVAEKFPSAMFDIDEAGCCLALGRSTACVMHMMRALEVALKALKISLDNQKDCHNWGVYIKEINTELERKLAQGGKGENHDFYAEAAVLFNAIRIAWRNPTMHPQKIYSQEAANDIYRASKSFLSHLAVGLSEEDTND